MKVVAIVGKQEAELVDKPEPQAAEDFVVVRITAAPMCTEYKAYFAGTRTDNLGHEAVGEVVEVAQPGCVKVGDRVVVQPQYGCGRCCFCVSGDHIHCQQGRDPLAVTGSQAGTATYAQYLLKQDWLLSPVPEDVSELHASMACCGLGPTFGAMETMQVDAFDTILITGLGPVGLGGVINARHRGARVLAVDSQLYRAKLALELGAEEVLDPADGATPACLHELTEGLGVDKAVDCSGASAAQRLCVEATRRKGQVAFVGEGGEVPIRVSDDMIRKGLTVRGSWHYNLSLYPRIMDVIRRNGQQLDKLITHQFPMSRVREAWELQMTSECGKIVLDPWS
ncbi:MAG: zinc-binding dehydrogenase [Armatimonadota bacterium]